MPPVSIGLIVGANLVGRRGVVLEQVEKTPE